MMDLYTAHTPNGHKVSILLEELQIPYQVYGVKLGKNELFQEKFIPIMPHRIRPDKIPVLVDREKGITLFESDAILIYLAEKKGNLLPENERKRWDVLQWLFVQMSTLGPLFRELWHYKTSAREDLPYAIKKYQEEILSLLRVFEHQLGLHPFISGHDYSIADVSSFAWIHSAVNHLEFTFYDFPSINNWYMTIHKRPAVMRGLKIPQES